MYDFVTPIIATKSITKMDIKVMDLVFFQSVSIMVSLYSEDGTLYDNRMYKLEGIDYTNWGADDNFIVNYVRARLVESH